MVEFSILGEISMKKYLIIISSFLLPFVALAHGMEVEEESGIGHQMEELSPFTHMGEGHYFAVAVSAILWVSLIYTIFSLTQKFRKPQ